MVPPFDPLTRTVPEVRGVVAGGIAGALEPIMDVVRVRIVELVTTGTDVARPTTISGRGAPDGDVGGDVRRAGAGVTTDFEAFYRAHADTVRRALAVTLGDAHVAAEATDEAMTRALARWRTVARHESPAGWVYRVGLNWAISRWRRLRRETPLADDGSPHSEGAAAGGGDPAGGAKGRGGWSDRLGRSDRTQQRGTAIAAETVEPPDPEAAAAGVALRRLPLDQRAVIVCRVLLECSTAETAALLDIPVGTVKSRLARGLAALRTTLDADEPEEEP
jgi:RNA polymerase sigma-70 factor (ECF subfamily)